MEAIKFSLSGKTAFFKKPDVNVNTYFTYNNIHKVAILGLLGALIGLKGHIQQANDIKESGFKDELDYPEFYHKLRDLKISIIPKGKNGYFTKKVQVFNNGVGYASKEVGGNLIVREQWLENPEWEIYILDDNSIDRDTFEKLKDYLLNDKCIYIPYLGKNDHPALISECEIVKINDFNNEEHIDSLFVLKDVEIGDEAYIEEDSPYLFKEFAPISLSKKYNFYEFKELCYTNMFIEKVKNADNIYKTGDKVIAFL